MNPFDNKIVLITGGTGSFGNKFVDIVLKSYNPSKIRIFSRGELLQVEMEKRLNNSKLRFFIGDVLDEDRLSRAMENVDIVVHAAALKHVPVCEYNPQEAVKTNIQGSMNVVNAVIKNEVKEALLISTDKAAYPVTLYGATKLVAEKLFIQGNAYIGNKRKTKLSVVRFGNVVGSRGSVIPIFLKQKETGKISITDKRMTRFWITQNQAINFVINALNIMQGGEIFIPKLPSLRIIDLANIIAPEAEKIEMGKRPGEKIHEILLTEEESMHSKEYNNYFIVEPEFPFWKTDSSHDTIENPFKYASDTNKIWLSKEELEVMINDTIQSA